jgi:ABC-type transport system involved in multi-copper enzyme maturation permease subunit
MNKLWVIALKDVGEAFRSRSIYIFVAIMLILTFSYVSSYNAHVNSLTNQQAINNFSRSFLNSLAYLLPLMYSIIICSIFANYSVILDKAKRNIESLMATPVSIQQIWLGKSLAVTLPSVAVGVSVSILIYAVFNIGFVIPKTGSFVFPDTLAFVSALIVVPILIFSIVAVVTHVQLIISNPRIANFVFTGIFILLVFGINALGGLGVSISFFPLICLGVIVICAVASFILSRSLTKERVLLSSKV